jgi:hypothetical protein
MSWATKIPEIGVTPYTLCPTLFYAKIKISYLWEMTCQPHSLRVSTARSLYYHNCVTTWMVRFLLTFNHKKTNAKHSRKNTIIFHKITVSNWQYGHGVKKSPYSQIFLLIATHAPAAPALTACRTLVDPISALFVVNVCPAGHNGQSTAIKIRKTNKLKYAREWVWSIPQCYLVRWSFRI